MIIGICYFFLFSNIKKELKKNRYKEKVIFYTCVAISIILALVYRGYLCSIGIEYGLANADMRNYIDLAGKVSNVSISEGFSIISRHWVFMTVNPISLWGYRLYIYFLAVTIFRLNILPIELSIYLISIFQVVLALYSSLIIFNSLKDRVLYYEKISLFFLLLAPSTWYGSVRLLRECFMILCMALLVKFVCSETKYKMSKILLVFLILTLIRPYYSVLFIPLIFMLAEKKQWAYFSSIFFFCILVIICLFSGTSLMQIVGVFLSPNFFNQAQYLTQSTAEVVLNTGYIPIINYIGSVWNLFMLLFAVFALLYQRKNPLIFISIAMILEMCMIYAFQYNGVTELRHKMFFVIPYVILFNEGCAFLRKGRSKILYIVGIIWFFILYTLLTLLLAN